MPSSLRLSFALAALALAAGAEAAAAKTVCGWYVIAACTSSQSDAAKFANEGWGAVIDTNHYRGFKPDLFCVVSGPQGKSSAKVDLQHAIDNNVAPDLYIKRACADDKYLGD